MYLIKKVFSMLKDRKGATMADNAVISSVLILCAIILLTSLGTTIVANVDLLVAGM